MALEEAVGFTDFPFQFQTLERNHFGGKYKSSPDSDALDIADIIHLLKPFRFNTSTEDQKRYISYCKAALSSHGVAKMHTVKCMTDIFLGLSLW